MCRFWRSLPQTPSLPGFLSYLSGSSSSPELCPPPLQLLPLCGCSPAPSNSCLNMCTYIFCPHCIIVICGKFGPTKLLHHYQKLKLSGIKFFEAKSQGVATTQQDSCQRNLSYLLRQFTVPSWPPPAQAHIYHFLLMMDCYWTHPTLCLSGSDNSQFVMGSSHLVHWSNVQSLPGLNGNSKGFSQKENSY